MDNIQVLLGSKSPRRHSLVKELGFPVKIKTLEVEEIYPEELPIREVPEYLAKLKTQPYLDALRENELLITSDTVVILKDELLGKPKDNEDAKRMLNKLSGNSHEVITGVCMTLNGKTISIAAKTNVHFKPLTSSEIDFYVDTYSPLDKAGSYGIQEWIGYIGITGIEGCYYNVMGLPVSAIHTTLISDFNLSAV